MKKWTERTRNTEPIRLIELRNEFIGSILEDFLSKKEIKSSKVLD